MTDDLISRDELLKVIDTWDKFGCDANTKLVPYQDHYIPYIHYDDVIKCIKGMPSVTPQEPKIGWNNHQIACMLADLFGDACACNYNGIDEWLGELCDFKDTCCPNPVGVACWEQFLKYSQSRYTECGYEVRDKNALQEPKTGHWIKKGNTLTCPICGAVGEDIKSDYCFNYCPVCGAKMVEPQGSEVSDADSN